MCIRDRPETSAIVSSLAWWYCTESDSPALTKSSLPTYEPSTSAKISSWPQGLVTCSDGRTALSGGGWVTCSSARRRCGGVVQSGHTDLGVGHAVEHISNAVDRLDGCREDDVRDDAGALVLCLHRNFFRSRIGAGPRRSLRGAPVPGWRG